MREEFRIMKLIVMFMVALSGFLAVSSSAYATSDPTNRFDDCSCTWEGVEARTKCQRDKADLEYCRARTKAMERCPQNGNCVFSD